jgi:hypothetical protein
MQPLLDGEARFRSRASHSYRCRAAFLEFQLRNERLEFAFIDVLGRLTRGPSGTRRSSLGMATRREELRLCASEDNNCRRQTARQRQEQAVSKTIIFCADGTWNGPENTTADDHAPSGAPTCEIQLTNVCKLFAWLQGEPLPSGASWGGAEMEKAITDSSGAATQIAKYVHGVGNSPQLLDKVAGGAFGVGVTARIARGYTYISRNYVPGDSIVIVGFSRGAYTARALAGLIAGEGLLKPELAAADDANRYDTAAAAWYRWRHGHDTTFQKIADGLTELLAIHAAFSKARTLTDDSFVPVDITAVAVWDTVGALGIPTYLDGGAIDLFRFCDTAMSPRIGLGVHAVALDEQRKPFQPTLWDASSTVVQALFPGGHCDVCGGYAEHGRAPAVGHRSPAAIRRRAEVRAAPAGRGHAGPARAAPSGVDGRSRLARGRHRPARVPCRQRPQRLGAPAHDRRAGKPVRDDDVPAALRADEPSQITGGATIPRGVGARETRPAR